MTPTRTLLLLGAFGALGLAIRQSATAGAAGAPNDVSWRTANAVRQAAREDLQSEYSLALAHAVHAGSHVDRDSLLEEAEEALAEGLAAVQSQFEGRLRFGDRLGDEPYDPVIDPDDFVEGVDHLLFPLVPGTVKTFEGTGDAEGETVIVTVTDETREILGVECMVVYEQAFEDGELEEELWDYFAQDVHGNVWYFGELNLAYEDGHLDNMDDTWIAGQDGAKAGMIMPASPQLGQTYRVEFKLGIAEDFFTVVARERTVQTPAGVFHDCLVVTGCSPIEPLEIEYLYFAPGVGHVFEVELGPDVDDDLDFVEGTSQLVDIDYP